MTRNLRSARFRRAVPADQLRDAIAETSANADIFNPAHTSYRLINQAQAYGSSVAMYWCASNFEASSMTFRIESHSEGESRTIRLIGRTRAEHLEEVKQEIRESGLEVVLDFARAELVDARTVRFLGRCESQGVRLTNCSAFIRHWIAREKEQSASIIT